jgi:hypothetical protein
MTDNQLYDLKKEFDKPLTDDQIDEIELVARQVESASYKNMDRLLRSR